MLASWAVVRRAGALVFALVAYVTASIAKGRNWMPPGPAGGSLSARPRADLAKSVQNILALVMASAVSPSGLFGDPAMPSDESAGRGALAQPSFATMMSWVLPVSGLVASQLNR